MLCKIFFFLCEECFRVFSFELLSYIIVIHVVYIFSCPLSCYFMVSQVKDTFLIDVTGGSGRAWGFVHCVAFDLLPEEVPQDF